MRAISRLKRWIALLVLAATTFAHASVAVAGCEMERRTLSWLTAAAEESGCGCDMQSADRGPLLTNRCIVHCTSDLQIAGLAVAIERGPCNSAVLVLPNAVPRSAPHGDEPPPAAVPIRILLHSFRI